MAHSGAHRRVALTMVQAFGAHSSRRLVLGFGGRGRRAVHVDFQHRHDADASARGPGRARARTSPALATPLLLGIAFSASVGGVGTPIGTPLTSSSCRSTRTRRAQP